MIFKDEVEIFVTSGKGGDGAVSFRREKFVPDGGPDGGDGGDGGNIIFKVNRELHTLSDFHNNQKFQAQHGGNGSKKKCFGKKGHDKILEVPPGTIISEILEDNSIKTIVDLSDEIESFCIAKGGHGGKGNIHFKSSVKQSPQYAQKGTLGDKKRLLLELKIIADIGLAGFPNAGKSSLISCLTNASPKIANYAFTTLVPNLGIMSPEYFGDSIIIADIPGLIEGASLGKGLGIEFLKHIERTKLLLFVLDITDSPEEKFRALEHELTSYSEKLSAKNYVVCFNKIDLMPEIESNTLSFMKDLEKKQIPIFITSAINRKGLLELKESLFRIYEDINKQSKKEIINTEDLADLFEDFTDGLDL